MPHIESTEQEQNDKAPNARGEFRCPCCKAKLLEGMFVGSIVCRKCGKRIERTVDQLEKWLVLTGSK